MQSTSRSHSRSPRPSQDGRSSIRTPRVVDFAEGTRPAPSQRESEPTTTSGTLARGRERTRSFLGLGFGSTTPTLSETESTGASARRKISFGPLGPAQSGAGPSNSRGSSPAPPPPTTATGRKPTSTAKAFIRRAKSFGTSPLLGSSADGGFDQSAGDGSPAPSSTHPSPTSPRPIPLPRTSTSSLLVATPLDSRYGSPAAFSPTSESASITDSGSPYPFANSRASTSSMVLPEALPAQPHWLFAPAPAPTGPPIESPGASSGDRSSSERASARRSQDAERRRTTDEGRPDVKGKGKAKASDKTQPTPKRKTRRATLGSLFGRKDSKASVDSSVEGVDGALDFAAPGIDRRLCDSPQDSPVPAFPDVDSEREAIPSLPSLPSLQLSKDPYRMSWGFAHSSPTSSPEKQREPRPRVAISTAVSNGSPGPSSPVVALTRAEEVVDADQTIILLRAQGQNDRPLPPPPPPILQHVQSTDSALTLQARRPSTATALDALETAREELKASTPPALRQRSNSYGFPNPTSPRSMYAASSSLSIPLTPSPLASPVGEPENPLSAANPAAIPASIPSVPTSGFAKSLIKTRTARSHSDASDRRSPSNLASSTGGASFSHSLSSSGATLPAMPRASSSRPTTADALTTSTRSSVFGSIGSFFSGGGGGGGGGGAGSASMSRSGSASTSVGNGSTPSVSPSLVDGMRETNEFGALFDGADRRSSSLARPGSSRKRGLSVGAGVGFGLFGASSSSASLSVPPAASTASTSSIAGRGRSGSTSSANTSVSGAGSGPLSDAMASLVVPPASLGSSLGGRMRALTDPNRRFSFGLPGSGSDTPGGSPARAANRPRGSSLSAVSQSHPMPPPPPKKARRAPKPRQDETPEDYVRRLIEGSSAEKPRQDARLRLDERASSDVTEDDEPIPRGELTQILSASSEPFFAQALRAFLRLFPFQGLALDIALRVFLGSAALPTETQHIDRVMEAFARRYCDCNPNVFGGLAKKRDVGEEGVSTEGTDDSRGVDGAKRDGQEESDIPYVLAFSMVMLNTDHFNPNAKTKMTKADYIRNTRIDGVAPEILEYLFDQITLAPFIYVDERQRSADSALRAPSPQGPLNASIGPSTSSSSFMSANGSLNGSSQFTMSGTARGKVDPYQLIASGQTARYRVDVESLVPSKSPFSFMGTTSFFDMTSLHALFARAPVLQIANRSRASSRSHVGPGLAGPGAVPASSSVDPSNVESPNPLVFGSPLLPTNSNSTFVEPPKKKDRPPISTLKITKVGLLSRKDDLAEGGKKAQSRKWRGWSVVLTGSQLLFFKDSHFASNLQSALDRASASADPRPPGHVLAFSYPGSFKPDAVLSLAHSVAIYDSSYAKYRNVFRLIVPAGRQYLFQAHDVEELNSWVHAINYAASFKSAGIKIRPYTVAPMLARSQRSTTPPIPAEQAHRAESPSGSGRLVRSQAHESLPNPGEQRRLTPSGSGSRRSSESHFSGNASDAQVTLSPVLGPAGPEPTSDTSLAARALSLRAKVAELDALIRSTKESLQADLRLARHLALLTPFRTSTRERILSSLPPIEKRVRHLRMQLAKYTGYREVLLRDLLVEDRESERLMRQRSLHRTHSRRTSSVPRQRSGASLARDSSLRVPNGAPQLGRSGSSKLRPSSLSPMDAEGSPRNSFESAAESLSAFDDAHEPAQHSLTDDELDRLHVKTPPPMQRSKTETDWVCTTVSDNSLLRPVEGGALEPAELLRVPGTGAISGDDELEEEAAGIDLPGRRSSESRRPDEDRCAGSPSSTLQSPRLSLSETTLPPPVPPIQE